MGPQPGIVLQEGDVGAATGPFKMELFGNQFSSAAVNNMTALFKRSWTRYELVLHLCGTGEMTAHLHIQSLPERIIQFPHFSPFCVTTTLQQDQETSMQATVMNSEKLTDCASMLLLLLFNVLTTLVELHMRQSSPTCRTHTVYSARSKQTFSGKY